jgi:hypothetical protein
VLVVMSVLVVVVAACSAADDLGIRQVALPLRLTDVADEVGVALGGGVGGLGRSNKRDPL